MIRKTTFTNLRFEVTTKCEFKCTHCHIAAESEGTHLSYSRFLEILDSMADSGVKKVRISGGEPALWPYINDAVSECHRRKIKLSVNTVEPSLIRILGELSMKKNEIQVTTTLNGVNSFEHDAVIGQKGHFNVIISVITEYSNYLDIDVNFPLTCENSRNVFNLHELLASKGVKRLCLNRLYLAGRARTNNLVLPSKVEMTALIDEVLSKSLYKESPVVTFANAIPFCIASDPEKFAKYNEGPLCRYGRESITISATGEPFLCVAFPWWGKTMEEASVPNFYESDIANNWRKNNYLPLICRKCNFVSLCRGGCRLAALENTGQIDGHDPLSKYA